MLSVQWEYKELKELSRMLSVLWEYFLQTRQLVKSLMEFKRR